MNEALALRLVAILVRLLVPGLERSMVTLVKLSPLSRAKFHLRGTRLLLTPSTTNVGLLGFLVNMAASKMR